MTHILIPREPSTALLRPFIGCNTQELHEAWAAMVRIAEGQHARAGSQRPAQIEEPAQPVAEICSASHDDAEFGERAIKPLRDISGFEYGTPLYAGAAPAAVAPCIKGLLDEDGENQAVRTFLMLYGTGLTVARMREHMELAGWPQAPEWALKPEAQGHLTKGGAQSWLRHLFALETNAPALEAPAAPAGWKLVPAKPTDAMLGAAQKAWLADPLRRSSTLYVAALAAAPQAPAAPSTWAGPVRELMGHLSDVLGDEAFAKIDTTRWNAVSALIGGAPAAPAAPAVDAPKELDPSLSREVYRACEDLPEGWSIRIDLENGYGGMKLIDPDGEEDELPVDGLLSDAMRASIAAAQAAAKGGGIVSKTERLGHANALIEIISRHGRRFFRNRESGAIARLELDASGRLWWIDEYRGSRVYTGKVMGYPHRWRGFSHGGTLRSLVEALRGYVLRGELLHPEYIAPSRIDPTNGDIWGYGAEAAAAVRAEANALPLFQRPTGHKEST